MHGLNKSMPYIVGLTRQKDPLEKLTKYKQEGNLEGYIKTLTYCVIELKFMRNKPWYFFGGFRN